MADLRMTDLRAANLRAANLRAANLRAANLRGLVVDWGGVLTSNLGDALEAWAQADGIDYAHYQDVMRTLAGEAAGQEARWNPVHALERGELEVPDFERRLAAALSERTGRLVLADGLVARMFDRFEHAPDMVGLVRRAHAAGLRTALLSNSWGNDYPRDGWDQMFDAVVISGEVGMRKPDPEIFEHTLALLGLTAPECVFVDDLRRNVRAAVALGFVGVHHTSYATTAAELATLFSPALPPPLRDLER
jgi:putative hydrolase of the HAD superfamily